MSDRPSFNCLETAIPKVSKMAAKANLGGRQLTFWRNFPQWDIRGTEAEMVEINIQCGLLP
jgi:hypothetical protein